MRKPLMIINVVKNGNIINVIRLKGKELNNRALTYLSGAYGDVVDKDFTINENRSTTLTFKIRIDKTSFFDTTIENFDLFML